MMISREVLQQIFMKFDWFIMMCWSSRQGCIFFVLACHYPSNCWTVPSNTCSRERDGCSCCNHSTHASTHLKWFQPSATLDLSQKFVILLERDKNAMLRQPCLHEAWRRHKPASHIADSLISLANSVVLFWFRTSEALEVPLIHIPCPYICSGGGIPPPSTDGVKKPNLPQDTQETNKTWSTKTILPTSSRRHPELICAFKCKEQRVVS